MRRNSHFFVICWMMCILLLFVPVLPQIGFAKGSDSSIALQGDSHVKKINPKVVRQFEKDKMVTYLVKFKKQEDTHQVAKKTVAKAKKQNATAYKTKQMKRSAIVSMLRATARETQTPLISFLNAEKEKGNVKAYRSFFIVNALSVTSTQEIMEQLAKHHEVEKILPNETRKIIGFNPKTHPSTPVVKNKSVLHANPQNIEWNIERVHAPEAWGLGIDGTGVVVANIDTGVQWDHPALKTKYRGYNPANPNQPSHIYNWFDATTTNQSAPYDDLEHGTHTMGTILGSDPNGNNQIGVAPGAKWIAVKAFTSQGGTDTDLLNAGEWIIAPKDAQGNPHPEMAPDVVNNSWGGGPGLDEWYRPMVQNWRAADIFPEFSAGNSGFSNPGGPGSVANPANYPESFATGATDINNQLAYFSLQGPSPYGEIKPEVSAPGVNIRSSIPGGNYEGGWSGTSMSGPHVTGIVALLKQANASLTVDEIEQILLDTSTPLTDSTFPNSPNNGYGHGLVNAFEAVSSVTHGLGTLRGQVTREGEDTEDPTYEHTPMTEVYSRTPVSLTLTAQDNISVRKVQLHYKVEGTEWKTLDAPRYDGNYKDGSYEAVIHPDDVNEPKITYYWTITDYGNHTVTSPHYEVTVSPGITTGYFQNFESKPTGWYSTGNNDPWEWGKPESGNTQAPSGEKIYGTKLNGKYGDNTNATLIMPPVNLPEGNSYLQFKQWYDLEANYDFGNIVISTDLQNWRQLGRVNGQSRNWLSSQVDLSSYAGQRVYIGFNLTTDISVTGEGWYLDDVGLSNTPLQSGNFVGIPKNPTAPLKKSGKKAIHPDTLKPAKITNTHPARAPFTPKKNQPMSLPIDAKVSVLETGRSVNTNPEDGSYQLKHATGDYTIKAEAYGFHSKSQSVSIPRDGEVTANFTLEQMAHGTLHGKVTNQATGEAIAGATLALLEDASVTPVTTDQQGNFSITAFEGTYTLLVSASKFHSQEIPVTLTGNSSTEQNVTLKPFIGYPGEIAYDDGTAENARAYYQRGNGWAVKMSFDKTKSSTAMLTAGCFRLWDTEWPTPGGTAFQVAVYDASGVGGSPGKKIAGPFNATGLRNGEWTVVDLKDKGIIVNSDFYLVYIQSVDYPNTPGLATDENGPNAGRSWEFIGGGFSQTPSAEGNYMIRARINYEVTSPLITSPTHGSFTNQSTITVKGQSAPTTTVKIYNKGQEAASSGVDPDGSFSIPVTLHPGENLITATASTQDGTTEPCRGIRVTLDQTKPVVQIAQPAINHSKTNKETITVTGTALDTYLDSVTINGKKATVQSNGDYSLRMMLKEGENTLRVIATDKAGNKTTKSMKIFAKFSKPVVSELQPQKDRTLKTGETLKITLRSEAGLAGTFSIYMPLTSLSSQNATPFNALLLPLYEESPGYYVGYWTVPAKLKKINGAQVVIHLKDAYGNEVTTTALGKIYIR